MLISCVYNAPGSLWHTTMALAEIRSGLGSAIMCDSARSVSGSMLCVSRSTKWIDDIAIPGSCKRGLQPRHGGSGGYDGWPRAEVKPEHNPGLHYCISRGLCRLSILKQGWRIDQRTGRPREEEPPAGRRAECRRRAASPRCCLGGRRGWRAAPSRGRWPRCCTRRR